MRRVADECAPGIAPNSSLSRRFSGIAEQLSSTNRPTTPRAVLVDHARELRLARAGLARDEDRDVERRHQLDLAQHLRERRAHPHDLVETQPRPERGHVVALPLPRADEEPLDEGAEVTGEGARSVHLALREGPARASTL